ncbi:hypothetical protein LY76DRAFT_51541 [Colletotrichum caudatum]|nr:hypothetical protein LY76DRAFT_51541 [Colletotrichum caudatum]
MEGERPLGNPPGLSSSWAAARAYVYPCPRLPPPPPPLPLDGPKYQLPYPKMLRCSQDMRWSESRHSANLSDATPPPFIFGSYVSLHEELGRVSDGRRPASVIHHEVIASNGNAESQQTTIQKHIPAGYYLASTTRLCRIAIHYASTQQAPHYLHTRFPSPTPFFTSIVPRNVRCCHWPGSPATQSPQMRGGLSPG